MKYGQLNLLKGLINDEKGQGSAELILIIGGIIVIILVVVSMYKHLVILLQDLNDLTFILSFIFIYLLLLKFIIQ